MPSRLWFQAVLPLEPLNIVEDPKGEHFSQKEGLGFRGFLLLGE